MKLLITAFVLLFAVTGSTQEFPVSVESVSIQRYEGGDCDQATMICKTLTITLEVTSQKALYTLSCTKQIRIIEHRPMETIRDCPDDLQAGDNKVMYILGTGARLFNSLDDIASALPFDILKEQSIK